MHSVASLQLFTTSTPGYFWELCQTQDLSSTFNSIRRHQVIKKLQRSPIILIYWIHNFLSNRPQVVKMGSALSPTIVLNTGRR